MKPNRITVSPNPVTGILIRRKFEHNAEETHWGEDRGRDQSVMFTSQGTPRTNGTHQELWEKHGTNSYLEFPEGTNLLKSGFWDSGLQNYERINYCCFKKIFYLFLETGGGREKERKRNTDVREKHWSVASLLCTDQGLSLQPRCVPQLESNQWPFGLQDDAEPRESHQLGQISVVLSHPVCSILLWQS